MGSAAETSDLPWGPWLGCLVGMTIGGLLFFCGEHENGHDMRMRWSRWLVVVVLLAFRVAACASPIFLHEDFEDDGGSGAFDPNFVHVIGEHPDYPGGGFGSWGFGGWSLPSVGLWLNYAANQITPLLDLGQYVSHASVDATSTHWTGNTVTFIGLTDSLTFGVNDVPLQTYEADMEQIGLIQGIRLTGIEGNFDNVRFTVVPEPSTSVLFVCGILAMRFGAKWFRKNKEGGIR